VSSFAFCPCNIHTVQDCDTFQGYVHRRYVTRTCRKWLACHYVVGDGATRATASSEQRSHGDDNRGFALTVENAGAATFIDDEGLVWAEEPADGGPARSTQIRVRGNGQSNVVGHVQ
jgi:hypothetical protein